MMTDAEFCASVRQRYQRRRQKRRQQQKWITMMAGVAGLMLVAAAAVRLLNGGGLLPTVEPTTPLTPTGSVFTTTNTGFPTTGTQETQSSGTEVTVETQPSGIGGSSPYRDNPFEERFWLDCAFSVSDVITSQAYHDWCMQFVYNDGPRPNYEKNVYTLIQEFAIPRETIEQLCGDEWERDDPAGAYMPPVDVLTPADIEMLYTGTKAEVYAYFLAEYAVLVGETPYSALWLATHTADEYAAAGMTAKQVEQAYRGSFSGDTGLTDGQQEHIREQLSAMFGATYTSPVSGTPAEEATVVFGDRWEDYSTDFQAFLIECGLTREVIEIPVGTYQPVEGETYTYTNGYMTACYEPGQYRHLLADVVFTPVAGGTEKTEEEILAIARRFAAWRIRRAYLDQYTETVAYDAAAGTYTVTYARFVNGYETFDTMTVVLQSDGQMRSYHQQDLNSIFNTGFAAFDEAAAEESARERLGIRFPTIRTGTVVRKVLTVKTHWRPAMYRYDNTKPYASYVYYQRTPVVVYEFEVYLTDGTGPIRDQVAVALEQ